MIKVQDLTKIYRLGIVTHDWATAAHARRIIRLCDGLVENGG